MSLDIKKNDLVITFLLLPGIHLIDLAGPAQVFYEAGQLGGADITLRFVSAESKIRSEQGLDFSGIEPIDDLFLTRDDFLIIPGIGFDSFKAGKFEKSIESAGSWLKKQFEKKIRIATICSGILIPAHLGLLANRSCTTHWKCIDYMKKEYPECRVVSDQLFVKDEHLYSSAGMTSGIDMSIAIIEEWFGPILAARIAREMVVFLRRDKSSSQDSVYLDYQTHFNPAVHRIQNYIISNPAENPSLETLSGIANMSSRNLTRTFRMATGHTITEFKQEVKADLAKTLMNNPDYTVESIAAECGYADVRQLQRVWKQKFGVPISAFRRREGVI